SHRPLEHRRVRTTPLGKPASRGLWTTLITRSCPPCTSLQNKRRFLHNQTKQLFSFSLVRGREERKGLRMAWWERVVVFPARRVWIGVATRLAVQRTGLKKLRKEVRTCEYEDVRVMWEILRKAGSETGRRPWPAGRAIRRRRQRRRRRRGHGDIWASLFDWAPCCLCHNFTIHLFIIFKSTIKQINFDDVS
ncbi:hypothetical protein B296_00006830, partial [Ensete ventricosum]